MQCHISAVTQGVPRARTHSQVVSAALHWALASRAQVCVLQALPGLPAGALWAGQATAPLAQAYLPLRPPLQQSPAVQGHLLHIKPCTSRPEVMAGLKVQACPK